MQAGTPYSESASVTNVPRSRLMLMGVAPAFAVTRALASAWACALAAGCAPLPLISKPLGARVPCAISRKNTTPDRRRTSTDFT